MSLQRTTDENGFRWYAYPNSPSNLWYISVTTVLGCVLHQRVQAWMRRTDGAKQEAILAQRSDEGTSFHDLVEADLRGATINVLPEQQTAFNKWLELKAAHNITAEETEVSVASDKYGYAGTFDIIGQVDGKRCLMDIKTGWMSEKAGWQLAAYRNALIEKIGKSDLGMVGIQLRSDGRTNLFTYSHYDWCFNRFLDSLGAFRGLYFRKLNQANWKWLHIERSLLP